MAKQIMMASFRAIKHKWFLEVPLGSWLLGCMCSPGYENPSGYALNIHATHVYTRAHTSKTHTKKRSMEVSVYTLHFDNFKASAFNN